MSFGLYNDLFFLLLDNQNDFEMTHTISFCFCFNEYSVAWLSIYIIIIFIVSAKVLLLLFAIVRDAMMNSREKNNINFFRTAAVAAAGKAHG